MDRINQIWPAWHTVELIGRGAFGEVYKAKREELGETFYSAVKIIQIPQGEEEIREMLNEGQTSASIQYYFESVARGLMNEIKVMETLKSAGNVVNIEEFEIQQKEDAIGWTAYIRMELLQNLNDYRKGRLMSREEVANLGRDICEALICCEQSRIIHRDIKPSNIFVDRYGNFKLGDFGIARQMEKTQSTLSRKGTELYMAPEVRFWESGSSYNVDIYSLGLVMYRLLNRNRMPFEPLDKEMLSYQEKEEALTRRLRGEALPLPADAGEELGGIILKACQADKAKRYQSAEEMKRDLLGWKGKTGTAAQTGRENRTEQTAEEAPFWQEAPEPQAGQEEFSEETVAFFQEESKEPEKEKLPRPGKDIWLDKEIRPGQKYIMAPVDGRRMQVTIPPEIQEGQSIRLKGEGEPGENGGPAGDMYFRIHIREEKKQENTAKETQKEKKEQEKPKAEAKQEAKRPKAEEKKSGAGSGQKNETYFKNLEKTDPRQKNMDEQKLQKLLILLTVVGAVASIPAGAIWAVPLIPVLILPGLLLMKKRKGAGAWLGALGSALAMYMILADIMGVMMMVPFLYVPAIFVIFAGFFYIIWLSVRIKRQMTQIIRS